MPLIFRYADAQKFSGNANVFLARALQRGLVERLIRGVYVNSAINRYAPANAELHRMAQLLLEY